MHLQIILSSVVAMLSIVALLNPMNVGMEGVSVSVYGQTTEWRPSTGGIIEDEEGEEGEEQGENNTNTNSNDDLEMELGLIQLPPALSPNPTDNYFKLTNYTIKVEGQNGTLQEGIDSRNYRVSMDQDTVFLTSLGTLEVESTDQEGIAETKLMPFNGLVNIDRVREDPKQNMTTYILNTGGLMVGDINMFDFGVDFDSVFLYGNLTLSPSEEDPDKLAGKLLLEGSGE